MSLFGKESELAIFRENGRGGNQERTPIRKPGISSLPRKAGRC